MTAHCRLRELHALLAQYRFDFCSEADISFSIAQILAADATGMRIEREFRLSPMDRLDFLIDDCIAIEIKIGGSAPAVMRQVARYAEHPAIAGILLVTAKSRHTLPESFNGKPLMVLSLVDGQL